jgi:Zn-dependent peptidase ImmA (M78 family)
MGVRVAIEPALLAWAIDRSRVPRERLEKRFPKLEAWENGELSPTLKQAEDFASATHTPIGMLMLAVPPVDAIPLRDFRTIRDTPLGRPSADLLDTIYLCEQRQEWYRDHVRVEGGDPVPFVGSALVSDDPARVGAKMRATLGFDVDERGSNWSEALRLLVDAAERAGIMLMVSGVVGSNSHRVLDPKEFRGFALADPLAPVIFVNGADTKAAQIFTIAHELAHLWIGATGVSDPDLSAETDDVTERWCNSAAAEFLVPTVTVLSEYTSGRPLPEEVQRLARRFKVSTLVVLRRLKDAGALSTAEFRTEYRAELDRILAALEGRSGGGNFYNTQPVRVSKRFAKAVVASTIEGQTLYRDAFRMLGFKSQSAFDELSHRLGVA